MGWVRERKLDIQEAWLVATGRIARGLRRLSPSALRETALELNSRRYRREQAERIVLRQQYREHPEDFPFHSAPTQPLDRPER